MVLDIREIGYDNDSPDLIVIMMNPGGSRPKDERNKFAVLKKAKFVPTHPDLTQWKIVEFMKLYDYKYARILNLSDLCESESNNLRAEEFKRHSNFFNNEKRKDYLDIFFQKNTDLLIAWGAKSITKNIIVKTLEEIRTKNCQKMYGYQHPKNRIFFYHPLLRTPKNQPYDVNFWLKSVKILDRNALKEMLTQ